MEHIPGIALDYILAYVPDIHDTFAIINARWAFTERYRGWLARFYCARPVRWGVKYASEIDLTTWSLPDCPFLEGSYSDPDTYLNRQRWENKQKLRNMLKELQITEDDIPGYDWQKISRGAYPTAYSGYSMDVQPLSVPILTAPSCKKWKLCILNQCYPCHQTLKLDMIP